MKLLLTSAGITNEAIASALSGLVGKSLTDTKFLFIISAANTEGGDKRWIIQNLNDLDRAGFQSIDIMDIASIPESNWKPRFDTADVICFGGGNELYLAEILTRPEIKEYLEDFPDDKVYMGISAGSMVAGKFMPDDLYPLVFPEENFGKVTTPALGLYEFCFIPHLNSVFFAHIRKENLESLKNRFTNTVYSTDDETAIVIDGGKIEIVGKGDYWVFNKKYSPKNL